MCYHEVVRFNGTDYTGLRDEEVLKKTLRHQANSTSYASDSEKQIVRKNVFTFFNLLYLVIFAMIASVGSWKNLTFMLVALGNTGLGIFQQIRAKRTLDKLRVVTMDKARVIREGESRSVDAERIVTDDLVLLERGSQIPSDGVLEDGYLEVNESMLTGESDALAKKKGDPLFAGSYVTSGSALMKVVRVGDENYAAGIVKAGRQSKKAASQLRTSLDRILKFISVIILPLGAALFFDQYVQSGMPYRDAILNVSSAILGMIPAGLMLLTSVALALSSVRLIQRRALVQEPYSIEALARTDIICMDKTGTLTRGKLEVVQTDQADGFDAALVLGNYLRASGDSSMTMDALRKKFPSRSELTLKRVFPFSSDRKYGGVQFAEGTYYLGAYEFMTARPEEKWDRMIREKSAQGYRVITLVRDCSESDGAPRDPRVCAVVTLSDTVRRTAPATVRYLESQGVKIKVLSGDDPLTASFLAGKAAVAGAGNYCDMSRIQSQQDLEKVAEDCVVFGRVTPEQKARLIAAMKKNGHHPAMIGDGVNDIQAIKEADCGIAMVDGADAAKRAADIVLLENNVDVLPSIIKEGWRVINNITLSSSMYLVKTVFSVILTILTLIFPLRYPFEPIQLSLISALMVGLPTLTFTATEPNYAPVKGKYFPTVMRNVLPGALSIVVCCIFVPVLAGWGELPDQACDTLAFLLTAWNYSLTLKEVYSPMTRYRIFVIGGFHVILWLCIFFSSSFFSVSFDPLSVQSWFLLIVFGFLSVYMQKGIRHVYDRIWGTRKKAGVV